MLLAAKRGGRPSIVPRTIVLSIVARFQCFPTVLQRAANFTSPQELENDGLKYNVFDSLQYKLNRLFLSRGQSLLAIQLQRNI